MKLQLLGWPSSTLNTRLLAMNKTLLSFLDSCFVYRARFTLHLSWTITIGHYLFRAWVDSGVMLGSGLILSMDTGIAKQNPNAQPTTVLSFPVNLNSPLTSWKSGQLDQSHATQWKKMKLQKRFELLYSLLSFNFSSPAHNAHWRTIHFIVEQQCLNESRGQPCRLFPPSTEFEYLDLLFADWD